MSLLKYQWLISLLIFSVICHGQTLFVCQVKGKIMRKGVIVKTGDKLKANDTQLLEFGSPTDYVVVVSPENGRGVISSKKPQQSTNHLLVLIKDNLIPCTKQNSLYSRSLTDVPDIRD